MRVYRAIDAQSGSSKVMGPRMKFPVNGPISGPIYKGNLHYLGPSLRSANLGSSVNCDLRGRQTFHYEVESEEERGSSDSTDNAKVIPIGVSPPLVSFTKAGKYIKLNEERSDECAVIFIRWSKQTSGT